MDLDGPNLNSTSRLPVQRSPKCLWFCSVSVRGNLHTDPSVNQLERFQGRVYIFFCTLNLINYVSLILACMPFSSATTAVLKSHGLKIMSTFKQNIDVIISNI